MSDYISRAKAIEALHEWETKHEWDYWIEQHQTEIGAVSPSIVIEKLPAEDVPVKCIATVQFDKDALEEIVNKTIIRCKDCKYFEYDHPYVIEGVPVLGHQVCNAWGDGCKTDENGWCFLGERKK